MNLKSKERKELILKLVEKSDVVLESFRPGLLPSSLPPSLRRLNPCLFPIGVLKRLGLDPHDLLKKVDIVGAVLCPFFLS